MKLLLRLIMLLLILSAQDFCAEEGSYYDKMRMQFDYKEENDSTACPFIDKMISQAIKEHNFLELCDAYQDAVYYSPTEKMKFADLAISAANKTGLVDKEAETIMVKASLYYFYERDYARALALYMDAYFLTEKSHNKELRNTIKYHIASVKSYIGDYNAALGHFGEILPFFEAEKERLDVDSNAIFNARKAYFNTIHQIIVCYQGLKRYDDAEKLLSDKTSLIPSSSDFELERALFAKCAAIQAYHNLNDDRCIALVDVAIPLMIKYKDFAWLSTMYYFKGKVLERQNKEGLSYFKKVDSIYNVRRFLGFQLNSNFKELIESASKHDITSDLKTYTNSFVEYQEKEKANNLILHQGVQQYDLSEAIAKTTKISSKQNRYKILVWGIVWSCSALLVLRWRLAVQKENISKKYEILLDKYTSTENDEVASEASAYSPAELTEEELEYWKLKLAEFERKKGFLRPKLNINHLADQLGTHRSKLSMLINTIKDCNFSTYMNTLRINYITELLMTEPKYLHYSFVALAKKSGFTSRQSFTHNFEKINGISISDFLTKHTNKEK